MTLHPNVKIEITVLENEAFKQKIATVMQSGNPPDIFRSWGGGVMNEYADAGLLRDITKEVDSSWGKSIGKGALRVYSYKGKYYGAPYDMGAVGIWYNKKIFAKLGLKPFKTWAELLEGVKKIKAAGIIPIAVGEGDKWPGHFWWVYLATRLGGQEAFDKAYRRSGAFTDPSFVKAGEMLKELVDMKPFQPGYLGAVFNDEAALMANSKAAMELMGQWAPYVQKSNAANKKGLGDDLGWMPFPSVDGGNGKITDTMGGGNGYILGKNAPDAAVDFLKFVISLKNNSVLAEQGRITPVVSGAEKSLKDANQKAIAGAVAKADYYQLYYDQYMPPAVGEVIKNAVQGIFAGKTSPQDAAAMIEKSAADNLKK
jgi:raffinose/stachyose/melibiose transport system substrate-binding protein